MPHSNYVIQCFIKVQLFHILFILSNSYKYQSLSLVHPSLKSSIYLIEVHSEWIHFNIDNTHKSVMDTLPY